jgi:16S rRNA C967 or C1407 C5-methylase (RsmB/RsmF family)/NOL1/NOP2/fmu family ribosome biogenesis protein
MSRNLPDGFRAVLDDAIGSAEAARLALALGESEPSLSARANPLKGAAPLAGADTVPWHTGGFYLPERPLFAADPAWHAGAYYVQDASSMAVGTLAAYLRARHFGSRDDLRYLDACAAPGGKTIGAIEALGKDAYVVANEADPRRAAILAENLAKHGAPGVAVTVGPAERFSALPSAFDIIAADAPCSGEGMMRKEPVAVEQWSPTLIESCAAMQRSIVESLWKALKPGGFFIYSTCTFNRREDEDVARHMAEQLGAEPVALPMELFPGALPGDGAHCCRFLPGRVRGEGLFMALLRKPDGEACSKKASKKRGTNAQRPMPSLAEFAKDHIDSAERFCVAGDSLVPRAHAEFAASLGAAVRPLSIGLRPAELKGRSLAPTHMLAMSSVLAAGSFPSAELDYASALAYLRGESLPDVPDGLPQGYFTPLWHGIPLGFAKNIGRRANNLYPDPLRLRLGADKLPASVPAPIVDL